MTMTPLLAMKAEGKRMTGTPQLAKGEAPPRERIKAAICVAVTLTSLPACTAGKISGPEMDGAAGNPVMVVTSSNLAARVAVNPSVVVTVELPMLKSVLLVRV